MGRRSYLKWVRWKGGPIEEGPTSTVFIELRPRSKRLDYLQRICSISLSPRSIPAFHLASWFSSITPAANPLNSPPSSTFRFPVRFVHYQPDSAHRDVDRGQRGGQQDTQIGADR
ncbi:hypothetical protein ACFX2I_001976 [Malus domestica]